MSRKERDRLRVLDQLLQGRMNQSAAASRMGLSVRQARRVQRRYESRGDAGLVHASRGRASNRRIDPGLRTRAQKALQERYGDYGPTLASECLAEEEGIVASRETVRHWMLELHLWGHQRKKHPHRSRRPRRRCFGDLVQMDTSEHDWLEGRGESCVLVTMIDDATGMKFARFFRADTTAANMEMIQAWIEAFGRPVALYTDWASHFKRTPTRGQKGRLAPTQIERALAQLDIELIAARSPQAKGRVERSHGTDQDRLVKGLRRAGAHTMQGANAYLETIYLPQINQRFSQKPASAVDAHRPLGAENLEAIFSLQEGRRVMNDYTVQIDGVPWQIERGEILGAVSKATVTVERRLNGTMRVRLGDRYLRYHRVLESALPEGRKKMPQGRQENMIVGVGSSALREGSLRSPSRRSEAPTPNARPKPKTKPAPNHPWRRTFLLCTKPDISTLR